MSGGSMGYVYNIVLDIDFELDSVERRAFKAHLNLVAKALRAIEWNDSGDGDDSESEAIRACISNADVIEQAIMDARHAKTALENEIIYAEKFLDEFRNK